jgi:hypothetical protein
MTFNETLTDWLTTFWKLLTSPTPKTFISESQKAEGKFPSAVAWLVFFTVYLFIFSIFMLGQVFIAGFIGILFVIPLTMILFTSAMNFVYQKVFKRTQYIYDKLIYLNTAILLSIQFLFVPISALVLVPLSSITFNAIVADVVLFYQFILVMIAFQSISGLKFWQAVFTVTVSIFAAAITLLCTIPFLLSMIGGVNATVR